jgi:hypothetical protein
VPLALAALGLAFVVVSVDGDRARSTWTVSEHADNGAESRGYFNYARYDDEFARTPDGWRYVTRHYSYYHLDQTAGRGPRGTECRPDVRLLPGWLSQR